MNRRKPCEAPQSGSFAYGALRSKGPTNRLPDWVRETASASRKLDACSGSPRAVWALYGGRWLGVVGVAMLSLVSSVFGCQGVFGDAPALTKPTSSLPECLSPGTHVPDTSEAETSGAIQANIVRGSRQFAALVRAQDANFVVKDEEGSGADRMMTPRLLARLLRLSELVGRQWPGVRLRVSEAWDERREHGQKSLHYEGRAADLTTSDRDAAKLGRLARLAVDAGLDWVYYEDLTHVHVSVRR